MATFVPAARRLDKNPTLLIRSASRAATVINGATTLYNAAHYREALGQYRSALATSARDQFRVLAANYLSSFRASSSRSALVARSSGSIRR